MQYLREGLCLKFGNFQNLEGQWKELNDALDDSARAGKERSEQLVAYESARNKLMQYLTTTENTIDNMPMVGLEQEIVKNQTEDLKVSHGICRMVFLSTWP